MTTELGTIRGNRAYHWDKGAQVEVLLRPDDVQPDPTGPLRALILSKTFTGATSLVQLKLPSGAIVDALFPGNAEAQPGDIVGVRLDVSHLVAFPAASA